MKKKTISFQVEPELHDRLVALARDDIRSLSNYMAQLVAVTVNSDLDLKSMMNPCSSQALRNARNGKPRAI